MNVIKNNALLLLPVLMVCKGMFAQILPTPKQIEIHSGFYTLPDEISILTSNETESSAKYLASVLDRIDGSLTHIVKKRANANIQFIIAEKNFGHEGYELNVGKSGIVIEANTNTGIFYGIQSLLQLLPAQIYKPEDASVEWKVPYCHVTDAPKHKLRVFMLDSGRQYQSPEFIKRYLDYMAMLKMNTFHWHLTEGQGWRIEIRQYPKLTTIGSKVAPGKEQQGFYTREEIREIVKYAADRHITIIPEIDVPGHSEAALTAYPELTCNKTAPESVMCFSDNLFCGGNEKTYIFLQNVLDEVCELFPGKYIHLGGDEAPKRIWDTCDVCQHKIKEEGLDNSHELQIYFTNRLAAYLKAKNKKVICWGDVITHPGPDLKENIVVHWWNYRRHKDKALKACIEQNRPIICGTNYYSYLNFPVEPWSKYKANRTFDLKTVYLQNPSNLSDSILARHSNIILGMSTCMWTDWFVQEHMIDQRVFPRIYALAEQMWHMGEPMSFDEFYAKVEEKYELLDVLGIDYGPAMKRDIPENYKWE